jgi:hypothetical protein
MFERDPMSPDQYHDYPHAILSVGIEDDENKD